jgi:hypothetical protein
VQWRLDNKASIRQTADHCNISTATVKRYMKEPVESPQNPVLKQVELEPGWLARSVQDARLRLAIVFSPMELVKSGHKVTLPLDKEAEDALFTSLDNHFYSWTGKRLKRQ